MDTPTTHRNEQSLKRTTKNIAVNISEKITSFFSVRRRCSEDPECPCGLAIKRRRSQAQDGGSFTSPVSVYNSPTTSNDSTLFLRDRGVALRLINFDEPSPFGSFRNLPVDVIHVLLDNLTFSQLGNLSATSKDWMKKIRIYVNSVYFEKKWIEQMQNFENSSSEKYTDEDPFYGIGVFIRKFTAIEKAFENRLEILQQYLKVAKLNSTSYDGCGRIIFGFMRHYGSITSAQYSDFFEGIFNVFHELRKELEEVLDVNDESYRHPGSPEFSSPRMIREMIVRDAVKSLLLSNQSDDPRKKPNSYFLSYLVHLFKPKGTNKQSKLLYLLYAPTIKIEENEIVHWRGFSEMIVNSEQEAKEAMKPMSGALRALMECNRSASDRPWTKNTVFNLMEELTTYPEPWSMNTFVSLLLMEPCLIPISIVARMHKSHQEEAGDMICTMKSLLHSWGVNPASYLKSTFKAIKSSLTAVQRRSLYESEWAWHMRNAEALRERQDTYAELSAEYRSQLELLPLLQNFIIDLV